MKLLILDQYRITKFVLPEKIEETFLIPYKIKGNSIDNVITIEAENNKWVIKSNGNVDVLNGDIPRDKAILDNYQYYKLKVTGITENSILYCMPYCDSVTYNLSIDTLDKITIGSSNNCHICYSNSLVMDIHACIKKEDNKWYIVNNKDALTYLNNIRVSKQILKFGDVIFINGLKMIWMGSYIKINNPNNVVMVKGLSIYKRLRVVESEKLDPVPLDEMNKTLYTEDDYFYHTPRLKSSVIEESVSIDPPPQMENIDSTPAILTIGSSITMAASSLMTGYTVIYGLASGTKTLISSIPQIVICIALILGCIVIPRVSSHYKKKKKRQKEVLRKNKYTAYLKKKEENINLIMKHQKQILLENNITPLECFNIVNKKKDSIWVREINDDDFLNVRLGIGSCPVKIKLNAPEKHFTLEEDDLFDSVMEVVNKTRTLEEIPITISFAQKNISSIICNCKFEREFIDGIILQLATLHSCLDLKIVVLTDEDKKDRWEYIKYLPHSWSDDKQIRFFATNLDESKEVSTYLEREFKNRQEGLKNAGSEEYKEIKKEKGYKNYLPYFIIINDNYKMGKNIPIINYIIKEESNCGFSLVLIDHSVKNLPNRCETFINVLDTESGIFEKDLNNQSQKKFIAEFCNELDMTGLAVKLSNIPVGMSDDNSELPKMITFLEMFGVSKIEQLNIQNRWESNNPIVNLSASVGVHTNGEMFKLDIHEKFHGPHGLIAGATGSGKSEFIISYILSMAINYHPNEVQFVLIDYKGGGLAGAFENKEKGIKLPHLAGTITNLDTAEMNRTFVAIDSELKRRQRLFNEVRDKLGESTVDIYKYQKFYREGLIDTPMAHLIIICDEFAELKMQQPEFMNQLISTSRIGRSLGVHLILATQKPMGIVNDQIWSNSKFKVCLKVQDRADSVGVLKKPDAASIKDVGRFYLQVGYDDYYDIGQSAWSGAKYIPSDKIIMKVDNSINFIDNCGLVIKTIDDTKYEESDAREEQLTSIIKYLIDISDKQNIKRQQLWLDPMPEYIYLDDIEGKYHFNPTPYVFETIIGEYDNPKEQFQGLLKLDITASNTLIYGMVGSGKENLLWTIVFSIIKYHTPSEVNFYILDFGSETLKIFNKMPHVGDVILLEDVDKINELIIMISNEIERRKELFSDYAGTYKTYCKSASEKIPLITIVINGYELFSENYSKQSDVIQTLIRDGSKYGIIFIVTTSVHNSIRSRTVQNFQNKIALQMSNESDYRLLLNAPKNLIPAKYFGRGIINIDSECYEFQTAYITDTDNMSKMVKDYEALAISKYKERANKIPVVPKLVTLDMVIPYLKSIKEIPIGISLATKTVYNYNFSDNNINLILSNSLYDKERFISALIKEFILLKANIKILDLASLYKNKINNNHYFSNNFEIILNQINNNKNKEYVMIIGLGEYKSKLNNNEIKLLNYLFNNLNQNNKKIIIYDAYPSFKNIQMDPIIKNKIDNKNGIWLGEGAGSQIAIHINDFSMDDRKLIFPFMGVSVANEFREIIKCVILDTGDFDE